MRCSKKILPIIFIIITLTSCGNKKEIFQTDALLNYMPLQVGKFITYRLDSTVFVLSGSKSEVHKYQVKHTIINETTDNTGQKMYVVQRMLNDSLASGPWINNGTYTITPYNSNIVVTNDNLAVTVLQEPLVQGFSWEGNSRLSSNPYQAFGMAAAGINMNDWVFSYTGFGNFSYQGHQYTNVWTVTQQDETINIPPTPDTQIGTKETSIERYAKDIGLVYKNYTLIEFHAKSADFPSDYYLGFGTEMWMVDHN